MKLFNALNNNAEHNGNSIIAGNAADVRIVEDRKMPLEGKEFRNRHPVT